MDGKEDDRKGFINMLRKVQRENEAKTIAACSGSRKKWTKLSIAMDSGASDSVINPKDIPGIELMETEASRAGEEFSSATDEPIPNLGEVRFPMYTREGTLKGMTMQGAPVSNPLGSVKKTCQQRHIVVFDDDGSFIYNKDTGETNILRESGGNYLLDVWIPPEEERNQIIQVFARPLP